METDNKSYSKHKGTLVTLIISTILFLLLIIPGIYVAMMSVMLFDAPGSTENPSVVAFFYSIVSFPVMCGLSPISWIFYAFKLYKTALFVSLSPILSIIAIIIMFFFMF
jgi:hypothetical protein